MKWDQPISPNFDLCFTNEGERTHPSHRTCNEAFQTAKYIVIVGNTKRRRFLSLTNGRRFWVPQLPTVLKEKHYWHAFISTSHNRFSRWRFMIFLYYLRMYHLEPSGEIWSVLSPLVSIWVYRNLIMLLSNDLRWLHGCDLHIFHYDVSFNFSRMLLQSAMILMNAENTIELESGLLLQRKMEKNQSKPLNMMLFGMFRSRFPNFFSSKLFLIYVTPSIFTWTCKRSIWTWKSGNYLAWEEIVI